MKNRFVVLIDFSPHTRELINFVYDWSQRIDAEIVMVHSTIVVYPTMSPTETKNELIQIANEDALNNLHMHTESIASGDTPIHYFVSAEPLLHMVHKLLAEPYNNLLFLGLKETDLLKKVVIGSQAIKIIDNVDNLIVAIPKNAEGYSREIIHVAVRMQYPLNVIGLSRFLTFAGSQVRKIVFFSVITQGDDEVATENYLRDLVKLFSEIRKDTSYQLFVGRRAFDDLKHVISQKKNEFIVIQRGSRMFTDQIFRKFLINELIYEGNIPLVILPQY